MSAVSLTGSEKTMLGPDATTELLGREGGSCLTLPRRYSQGALPRRAESEREQWRTLSTMLLEWPEPRKRRARRALLGELLTT